MCSNASMHSNRAMIDLLLIDAMRRNSADWLVSSSWVCTGDRDKEYDRSKARTWLYVRDEGAGVFI
jgi:hypothetical protein